MALTYLLANKDTELLETTVFNSEEGDAVIVFTDRKHADAYIEAAQWGDEMVVAELNSIAFIEWLVQCFNNGVKLMAVDPRREEQERNERITTLNVEAQLENAGNHIFLVANPDF